MMQLEHLDRGLVAALTSEGVFLSWRLLATEVIGCSDKGLTGADFVVYRDGVRVAAVRDSTNYLDCDGTSESVYYVCTLVGEREVDRSAEARPWRSAYCDIPLVKPADGITPAGEAYTYAANDMSVGDVDGDGQYEFFVKWDPSNAKDVSHSGYTGPVYIDCYKLDGALLYRVDLGVNIRAGAHYTQFLVYDFDGDGKAELMLKTAPGTKVIRFDSERKPVSETYITLLPEDAMAGYGHQDDYRISSADYYEHIVRLFMGWHAHEEVANGHWPATLEQCFGIESRYRYPLSREDAERLADYFLDVYAPSRSAKNNLRVIEGFATDDVGRGMIGQVDPRYRGLQTWSSEDIFSRQTFGLMTAAGEQIDTKVPGTNMSIRWAADMTTQIVGGSFDEPVVIEDWRRGRLLTADGARSNNGTKGNPCLVADVFGDWREELLVRTADSSAIRIYLSTEVTDRKLYTLMHDAQYRTGVAWQNVAYNQPCYPYFYFASDIDWSKVPIPKLRLPRVNDNEFEEMDRMVEHLVLFKLKPGTTEEQRKTVVDTLKRLSSIDGIVDMSVGVNHSKEGKSQGFEVGMRVRFRDQAALESYLPHPQHVGVVDEVREYFEDVIVVDYNA